MVDRRLQESLEEYNALLAELDERSYDPIAKRNLVTAKTKLDKIHKLIYGKGFDFTQQENLPTSLHIKKPTLSPIQRYDLRAKKTAALSESSSSSPVSGFISSMGRPTAARSIASKIAAIENMKPVIPLNINSFTAQQRLAIRMGQSLTSNVQEPLLWKEYSQTIDQTNIILEKLGEPKVPKSSMSLFAQWDDSKKAETIYAIAAITLKRDETHQYPLKSDEWLSGKNIIKIKPVAETQFPKAPGGNYYLPFSITNQNGELDPKKSGRLLKYMRRRSGGSPATIQNLNGETIEGIDIFYTGTGTITPTGGALINTNIGQVGYRGTVDVPLTRGNKPFSVQIGKYIEPHKKFRYGNIGAETSQQYGRTILGFAIDEKEGYPIERIAENRTLGILQGALKDPSAKGQFSAMPESVKANNYQLIVQAKEYAGIVENIVKYKCATLKGSQLTDFIIDIGGDPTKPFKYNELGLKPIEWFLRHQNEFVKTERFRIPVHDSNIHFVKEAIVPGTRDPENYNGISGLHMTTVEVQGIKARILPNIKAQWEPKTPTKISLLEMQAIRNVNPKFADALKRSGESGARSWRDLGQTYMGHEILGEGPEKFYDLSDPKNREWREKIGRVVDRAELASMDKNGAIDRMVLTRNILTMMASDKDLRDKNFGYATQGQVHFTLQPRTLGLFTAPGGKLGGLDEGQELELTRMGATAARGFMVLGNLNSSEYEIAEALVSNSKQMGKTVNTPKFATHLTAITPGKNIAISVIAHSSYSAPPGFVYIPGEKAGTIGYLEHSPHTDPSTYNPGKGIRGEAGYIPGAAVRLASMAEVLKLGEDPSQPLFDPTTVAALGADVDSDTIGFRKDRNAGFAKFVDGKWVDKQGRLLGNPDFWGPQATQRAIIGAGNPMDDALRNISKRKYYNEVEAKLLGKGAITPTTPEMLAAGLNLAEDIGTQVGPVFNRTVANIWAIDQKKDPKSYAVMQKIHGALYALTQRPTELDPSMKGLVSLMRTGEKGWSKESDSVYLGHGGYNAIYKAAPRLFSMLLNETTDVTDIRTGVTSKEYKFTPEEIGTIMGLKNSKSRNAVTKIFAEARSSVDFVDVMTKLRSDYSKEVSQSDFWKTAAGSVLGAQLATNLEMTSDSEIANKAKKKGLSELSSMEATDIREKIFISGFGNNTEARGPAELTAQRMRDMLILTGKTASLKDLLAASRRQSEGTKLFPMSMGAATIAAKARDEARAITQRYKNLDNLIARKRIPGGVSGRKTRIGDMTPGGRPVPEALIRDGKVINASAGDTPNGEVVNTRPGDKVIHLTKEDEFNIYSRGQFANAATTMRASGIGKDINNTFDQGLIFNNLKKATIEGILGMNPGGTPLTEAQLTAWGIPHNPGEDATKLYERLKPIDMMAEFGDAVHKEYQDIYKAAGVGALTEVNINELMIKTPKGSITKITGRQDVVLPAPEQGERNITLDIKAKGYNPKVTQKQLDIYRKSTNNRIMVPIYDTSNRNEWMYGTPSQNRNGEYNPTSDERRAFIAKDAAVRAITGSDDEMYNEIMQGKFSKRTKEFMRRGGAAAPYTEEEIPVEQLGQQIDTLRAYQESESMENAVMQSVRSTLRSGTRMSSDTGTTVENVARANEELNSPIYPDAPVLIPTPQAGVSGYNMPKVRAALDAIGFPHGDLSNEGALAALQEQGSPNARQALLDATEIPTPPKRTRARKATGSTAQPSPGGPAMPPPPPVQPITAAAAAAAGSPNRTGGKGPKRTNRRGILEDYELVEAAVAWKNLKDANTALAPFYKDIKAGKKVQPTDLQQRQIGEALKATNIIESTVMRKGASDIFTKKENALYEKISAQFGHEAIQAYQGGGTISSATIAGTAGGRGTPLSKFMPEINRIAGGESGVFIPGAGPETRLASRFAQATDRAKQFELGQKGTTELMQSFTDFTKSQKEFSTAMNVGNLKAAGKSLEQLAQMQPTLKAFSDTLKERRSQLDKQVTTLDRLVGTLSDEPKDKKARTTLTKLREDASKASMETTEFIDAIKVTVDATRKMGDEFVGKGGKTRGGDMDADNLFGTGLSWWMAGAVAGQGEQFMKTIGQEMSKYELRKMQGLYAAGVYGTGGEAVSAMTAGPYGHYRQAMAQEEMANLKFGRAAYTGMAGGIRGVATGIKDTMASMPIVGGMVPLIAEFATQAAPLAMDALIIGQIFKDKSIKDLPNWIKGVVGSMSKFTSAPIVTQSALPGFGVDAVKTTLAGGGATLAGKGLIGAITGPQGLLIGAGLVAAAQTAIMAGAMNATQDVAAGKPVGTQSTTQLGYIGGGFGAIGGFLSSGPGGAITGWQRGESAGKRNAQGWFGLPLGEISTAGMSPEERYTSELESFYTKNAALFPTQGAEGGIQQAQMITTALRRGAGFTPGQQKGMIFSSEEQHLIAQTASQALVSGFAQPEVYTELVDSIRRAMAPAVSQQQWADTFGEKIQGTIASDPYNLQQMGQLSQSLGFYGKVATGGAGINPQTATNFLTNAIAKGETGQNFIRALWGAGPEMIQQAGFMLAGREDMGAYNTQTGYTRQQEGQIALNRSEYMETARQAAMKYGLGVLDLANQNSITKPVGTAAAAKAYAAMDVSPYEYNSAGVAPQVEPVTPFSDRLITATGNVLRQRATAINPILGRFVGSVGNVMGEEAQVNPNALNTLKANIDTANNFIGFVKTGFDEIGTAIGDIGTSIRKGVSTYIKDTFSAVGTTTRGIMDFANPALGTTLDAAGNLLGRVGAGMLPTQAEKDKARWEAYGQAVSGRVGKDTIGTAPAIEPEGLRMSTEEEEKVAAWSEKYGAKTRLEADYSYQTNQRNTQNAQRIQQNEWQEQDLAKQKEYFEKRTALSEAEFAENYTQFKIRRTWQIQDFNLAEVNQHKIEARTKKQWDWEASDRAKQQTRSDFEFGLTRGLSQKQQEWRLQDLALQEQQIGKSQGRNQVQYQWQMEDISRNQSQSNIQYGWSVSDINDEIRFATGRQRRKLTQQRSRMATQQGWQNEEFGIQRERAGTQMGWSQEDFKLAYESLQRQREQAIETYRVEEALAVFRKTNTDADLAEQEARAAQQKIWTQEDWVLADEDLARQQARAQVVFDSEDRLQTLRKTGMDADTEYNKVRMANDFLRYNAQRGWDDARFGVEEGRAALLKTWADADLANETAHTAIVLANQTESLRLMEQEMARGATVAKYIIDELERLMKEAVVRLTPSGTTTTNGYAAGGPVSSNKTVLVGERGPELFTPSTSGTIIPNSEISKWSTTTKEGLQIQISVTPTSGFEKYLGKILFVEG